MRSGRFASVRFWFGGGAYCNGGGEDEGRQDGADGWAGGVMRWVLYVLYDVGSAQHSST